MSQTRIQKRLRAWSTPILLIFVLLVFTLLVSLLGDKSLARMAATVDTGGAKIDDEAVTDAGKLITAADLSSPLKLSAGKKRHALVQLG